MIESQDRLDGSGRAGGGEKMADHRFDRPDWTSARPPSRLPPEPGEAPKLHPVAHRSPGAVTFDEVNVGRLPPGDPIGRSHGPNLPVGVRRQKIPPDIIGQPQPPDDRVNPVPVGPGVGQPFENQEPGSLAHHQPVSIGVKRSASARRRKRPELAEPHLGIETVGPRNPAGKHRVSPTVGQSVTGQINGVKRRRAGRVQSKRRPAQLQTSGNQSRRQTGHRSPQPGRRRNPPPVARLTNNPAIQLPPQQHPGQTRRRVGGQGNGRQNHAHADRIGRPARAVRQSRPSRLKRDWVERVKSIPERFTNPQTSQTLPSPPERRVVNEPRPGRPGPIRSRAGADDIGPGSNPSALGHLADGHLTSLEVSPESRQVRSSRKKAGHADHRNGGIIGHQYV